MAVFVHGAVAVVRANHPGVLRGSVQALPFQEGSFDVCISSHVIEHLERQDLLVREAATVLKPGGTLVLLYPWEMFHGMTVIPDLVASGQFPLPSRLRRIHRHVITPDKIRTYAQGCGLREEKAVVFWGFPYVVPQYFCFMRKL